MRHNLDMDFDLPESGPTAEPADHHRPGPGWVFFILVLLFAIGSQLPGYISKEPEEKKEQAYRQVGTALKLQFLSAESAKAITSTEAPPLDIAETKRRLDPYLKQNDAQASALWVATQQAAGKKIDPKDLVPLERSQIPYFKSIARVYQTEKFTEAEADALAKELTKGITGKISAVEAYRRAGVKKPIERVFTPWELHRSNLFVLIMLMVLGLAVVLWIIYGAMRAQGKLIPAGPPTGHLTAQDADRFAFKAGTMLLLPMAVPFLISPFFSKDSGPIVNLTYYAVMIVAILVVARAPVFGKTFTLRKIGWRKDRLLSDAGWGLAATIANVPVLLIVAKISDLAFQGLPEPEHPAAVAMASNPSIWTIVITMFAASIAAPIIEETMFRGFLVPALARATGGFVGAWIVGGVAFAAVHPTGIPAWLPLAAIGAMAAMLNYQTNSLVSSVFMHAFHNLATLAVALLILN